MLALVIGDDEFPKETGKGWLVPDTQGAIPTIAANASAINKKKTIPKFIQVETDILIVELAKELLKGQVVDAIDECYIKELRQGYSEYDNRILFELLEHVKTKYAALGNHVLADICATVEEPPNLLYQLTCTLRSKRSARARPRTRNTPSTMRKWLGCYRNT